MIAQSAFTATKERAAELLMARGYEPVLPVESSFLSRYIPLHLVGLKGNYEMLGVKIRIAYGSVSPAYVESFCRYEICQFRSLLTMNPGNVFIRCEVWVVSPNGSIHCYEVLPNEIREVAVYAR
ncbi:hypothetical protein [uncultured Methanoregula sp.]|uniref:hypothetical protein n=1 Tax=uncultured Methanoregula sp. TaxID=1005933 RepID=UPI002AAA9326|nr:hypothetical protein [uncultured Methanoregula sp.]